MGAWVPEPFDNEGALDWASDLRRSLETLMWLSDTW